EQQLEAAGAAESAHTAHSSYYLRFVVQRGADIKGRQQQLGLSELRMDLENIRAALFSAVDHEQYASITTSVLDCLVNFGEMGGLSVGIQLLLKQLETEITAKFDDLTAPLLDQIAIRYERMGMFTGFEVNGQHLETILKRVRQRGDQHEIAY